MNSITYSIIAPIFNEAGNLPELHRRVREVMNSTGEPWELLLVDDQLRSMISTGAGQHQLLKYATKLGYRSLRYDGLKKVLLGLTTIEEIEKHTVLEWDPKIAEDIIL